ncbi:MAG: serpin family protein [Desulfitobacteriaceae bacterium]|nr:serpin family protein [Desulfitobacteriaceae bacterium]
MKKIVAILLGVLVFLSTFTSCSVPATMSSQDNYDLKEINPKVIKANNEFAFDLFKTLNDEDPDQSIFISPLSISTALTMTYNGAETTTKQVMSQVLGFNSTDREVINESYNNLLKYLQQMDKTVELNIANSIWIREGQEIKEEFLENNKNNFNARIDTLDFSKDSSVDTINRWIKEATKGKIDRMLEPPINRNVIMYFINGIYFKGKWSNPFDSKQTEESLFHTFDGKVQPVKMMNQSDKIEYMESDNYKAVRLPYGSGKTSMYCILPDEGININEFLETMDMVSWGTLQDQISVVDNVNLKIPKFKLEYGIKSLNDSLQSMGMEEAFDERADFSGIRDEICISRVLHKAVIEVNEEGSEAAAATVVEIKETAAALEPTTFIADRPFLFIIADDTTGTILFMGKLLAV